MHFDDFNFRKMRIKFEKDNPVMHESWIREKIEDLKKKKSSLKD